MRVDDVDVEWVLNGSALNGVDLVMRGLVIQPDLVTGVIMVRDPARDVVAFRVASFVADSIYALAGHSGLDPQQKYSAVRQSSRQRHHRKQHSSARR
jgi:hypothetical protein